MFFLKKTPKWMYYLISSTKSVYAFPPNFCSILDKKYLSLFDPQNAFPEKTLEFNDEKTSKTYLINLITMKMKEKNLENNEYQVYKLASSTCEMLGISIVVCRNSIGKFLAVNENNDRGWYLPGGKVDPPESFEQAAIRESKEEAKIDIVLKGVLKHEYNFIEDINFLRYKVVFYAEPKDEKQLLKSIADSESKEARWVTLKELEELGKQLPGLRSTELLDWGRYLEKGGEIYPIESFSENKSLF